MLRSARTRWLLICIPVLVIVLIAIVLVNRYGSRIVWPGPAFRTATPGLSAPSFSNGLYSLQALIDFDSLEGASFDPETKTLALFGRHRRPDKFIQIPYLDHLASALESDSPTFSLEWTPSSKEEVERARHNKDSFFKIFDEKGKLNALGEWLFTQGGARVTAGMDREALYQQVDKAGGFQAMFRNRPRIHVPLDIVRLAYTAIPRVKPKIKGLPTHSLLAQVALEADIIGKYLMEAPELKKRLPDYVTQSEWEQMKGDVEDDVHVWIAPDEFQIVESADGRSMRFESAPMRFWIQKYRDGQSTVDPILSGYAQLLTRHYNGLADQFPILQELRESLKVLAVAEWLKRHGWRISLPQQGRVDWELPTEVAGIVHMVIDVQAKSDSDVSIKAIIWPTGGIDLRIDGNSKISQSPDMTMLPVISPVQETNEELRRILRQQIEVPLPEIPGWVAQARGGQRALSYVALQADKISKGINAAAAVQQLEKVRRKAMMLDYYDRLINAATRERTGTLPELARLGDEAKTKRDEWLRQTFDTLTSITLAGHELRLFTGLIWPRRSAQEVLEMTKTLDQVKNLLADVNSAAEGLKRGKFDAEYWTRVTERVTELSFVLHETFRADPRDWVYGTEMGARRSLVAATAYGLYGLGMKFIELKELQQTVGELEDSMGARARDLAQIQRMRQRYFDEYLEEKRKFEEMTR